MWAARSWGAEGARGDAIISLEQWAHSARCDEKIDSSSSRAWTGCRTCPGVKAATVIRCESARVMRDATCVQSRSAKAGVRGGVEAKGWGGQIGRQSRRREGGREGGGRQSWAQAAQTNCCSQQERWHSAPRGPVLKTLHKRLAVQTGPPLLRFGDRSTGLGCYPIIFWTPGNTS